MRVFEYKSREEYLTIQYDTNAHRKHRTIEKVALRSQDIDNIESHFVGRRCLCLGCRHDSEVDAFTARGFTASGIDILPTERQVLGDMHELHRFFAPSSFDICYCCHGLEHSRDPLRVLREVRDVCAEGLYLVLPLRDAPNEEEPVLLDFMRTHQAADLAELQEGLGAFTVAGIWLRTDASQPSGAEVACAIKWRQDPHEAPVLSTAQLPFPEQEQH